MVFFWIEDLDRLGRFDSANILRLTLNYYLFESAVIKSRLSRQQEKVTSTVLKSKIFLSKMILNGLLSEE